MALPSKPHHRRSHRITHFGGRSWGNMGTGVLRVSTGQQSLDQQHDAIAAAGITEQRCAWPTRTPTAAAPNTDATGATPALALRPQPSSDADNSPADATDP